MKSNFQFSNLFLPLGITLNALVAMSVYEGKAAILPEAPLPVEKEYSPPVTIIREPSVTSIVRANPNPSNAESVDFVVTFSEPVTGVDMGDFIPVVQGVGYALVTDVVGAESTYAVSVYTGYGNGTLSLDVVDYDTIKSASGVKLGGNGVHNGSFSDGETYTIIKPVK